MNILRNGDRTTGEIVEHTQIWKTLEKGQPKPLPKFQRLLDSDLKIILLLHTKMCSIYKQRA